MNTCSQWRDSGVHRRRCDVRSSDRSTLRLRSPRSASTNACVVPAAARLSRLRHRRHLVPEIESLAIGRRSLRAGLSLRPHASPPNGLISALTRGRCAVFERNGEFDELSDDLPHGNLFMQQRRGNSAALMRVHRLRCRTLRACVGRVSMQAPTSSRHPAAASQRA